MHFKSFISALLGLSGSITLSLVMLNINTTSLAQSSAGQIVAIVVMFPIYLIMWLVDLSFTITSIGSSLMSCKNENKFLKVISIIFVVLSVLALILFVVISIQASKFLK